MVALHDPFISPALRKDLPGKNMPLLPHRLGNQLHPLQHFLPGAGKSRFLRLVFKPADQLILSGDFRLLPLIGLFLLLHIFKLLGPVLTIIPHIPGQLPPAQLIDDLGGLIQEKPVMADHDYCLFVGADVFLQPFQSFHIQMIGWLI